MEAALVSFFDSVDRSKLKAMLGVRVVNRSLMRLIGKGVHVGVRDGATPLEPALGPAQGSVLSPLVGNLDLHYALDLWFATEGKPRLQGKATLMRSGDDCSIGVEREDEARRVVAVLNKRMGRFGLALPPDKTRLLPLWRLPTSQQRGKDPGPFDVLGFTCYWARSRKGHWWMTCKPRWASLRRAKTSLSD